MGYICGENIIIYNEGRNNIWSLFHKYGKDGASIIKSRIYDVVHTTVILGYKINHNFYKNYKFVDEIYIKESGVFYNIDLTNTFTKQIEHIILPCEVFDDNMPVEKLHFFVKQWLGYFEIWQIAGGAYGKFTEE